MSISFQTEIAESMLKTLNADALAQIADWVLETESTVWKASLKPDLSAEDLAKHHEDFLQLGRLRRAVRTLQLHAA